MQQRVRETIFAHVWSALDSLQERKGVGKDPSRGGEGRVVLKYTLDHALRERQKELSNASFSPEGSPRAGKNGVSPTKTDKGSSRKSFLEMEDGGPVEILTSPNEAGGYLDPEHLHNLAKRITRREVLSLRVVRSVVKAATTLMTGLPVVRHITIPQRGDLVIVGDLHGQLGDLLYILDLMGQPGPRRYYLFNGDFVDRGKYGCEVAVYIFALLCTYPQYVFLNRGNHEDYRINSEYGFLSELCIKYNLEASGIHDLFLESYCVMSLLTVVDNRVAIVHGGVPREPCTLMEIEAIGHVRDIPVVEQTTRNERILVDLLWNDPVEKYRSRALGPEHQGKYWRSSKRGCGVEYLSNITELFLKLNNLELVIRSHDVKLSGFEIIHSNKCITIFSSSNYGGVSGNRGAVAVINKEAKQPVFHTWYLREDTEAKAFDTGLSVDSYLGTQKDNSKESAPPNGDGEGGVSDQEAPKPSLKLPESRGRDILFYTDEFIRAFYGECLNFVQSSSDDGNPDHSPLEGGDGGNGITDKATSLGPISQTSLVESGDDPASCNTIDIGIQLENSLQLQLRVVNELRDLVFCNRYALLSAFSSVDEQHLGFIYKVEWCTIMNDVLCLDLPWYYLAQFLTPRLEVDGVPCIEYARFLYHFDALFSADYRPCWQRFMIRRIFSTLDLPDDVVAVFLHDSKNDVFPQKQDSRVSSCTDSLNESVLIVEPVLTSSSRHFTNTEGSPLVQRPQGSFKSIFGTSHERNLSFSAPSSEVLSSSEGYRRSQLQFPLFNQAHEAFVNANWWREILIDFKTFATKLRTLSPVSAALEDDHMVGLFTFFDLNSTGHVFLGTLVDYVQRVLQEFSDESEEEVEELHSVDELDFSSFTMYHGDRLEGNPPSTSILDIKGSPTNDSPRPGSQFLTSAGPKGWNLLKKNVNKLPRPPSSSSFSSISSKGSDGDHADDVRLDSPKSETPNDLKATLDAKENSALASRTASTFMEKDSEVDQAPNSLTKSTIINTKRRSFMVSISANPSNSFSEDNDAIPKDLLNSTSAHQKDEAPKIENTTRCPSQDLDFLEADPHRSSDVTSDSIPVNHISKDGVDSFSGVEKGQIRLESSFNSQDNVKHKYKPTKSVLKSSNVANTTDDLKDIKDSTKNSETGIFPWVYSSFMSALHILYSRGNMPLRLEFAFNVFNKSGNGRMSEAEFPEMVGFLNSVILSPISDERINILFHCIRKRAFSYLKALQLEHAAMVRLGRVFASQSSGLFERLRNSQLVEITSDAKRMREEEEAGGAFILKEEFIAFFSIIAIRTTGPVDSSFGVPRKECDSIVLKEFDIVESGRGGKSCPNLNHGSPQSKRVLSSDALINLKQCSHMNNPESSLGALVENPQKEASMSFLCRPSGGSRPTRIVGVYHQRVQSRITSPQDFCISDCPHSQGGKDATVLVQEILDQLQTRFGAHRTIEDVRSALQGRKNTEVFAENVFNLPQMPNQHSSSALLASNSRVLPSSTPESTLSHISSTKMLGSQLSADRGPLALVKSTNSSFGRRVSSVSSLSVNSSIKVSPVKSIYGISNSQWNLLDDKVDSKRGSLYMSDNIVTSGNELFRSRSRQSFPLEASKSRRTSEHSDDIKASKTARHKDDSYMIPVKLIDKPTSESAMKSIQSVFSTQSVPSDQKSIASPFCSSLLRLHSRSGVWLSSPPVDPLSGRPIKEGGSFYNSNVNLLNMEGVPLSCSSRRPYLLNSVTEHVVTTPHEAFLAPDMGAIAVGSDKLSSMKFRNMENPLMGGIGATPEKSISFLRQMGEKGGVKYATQTGQSYPAQGNYLNHKQSGFSPNWKNSNKKETSIEVKKTAAAQAMSALEQRLATGSPGCGKNISAPARKGLPHMDFPEHVLPSPPTSIKVPAPPMNGDGPNGAAKVRIKKINTTCANTTSRQHASQQSVRLKGAKTLKDVEIIPPPQLPISTISRRKSSQISALPIRTSRSDIPIDEPKVVLLANSPPLTGTAIQQMMGNHNRGHESEKSSTSASELTHSRRRPNRGTLLSTSAEGNTKGLDPSSPPLTKKPRENSNDVDHKESSVASSIQSPEFSRTKLGFINKPKNVLDLSISTVYLSPYLDVSGTQLTLPHMCELDLAMEAHRDNGSLENPGKVLSGRLKDKKSHLQTPHHPSPNLKRPKQIPTPKRKAPRSNSTRAGGPLPTSSGPAFHHPRQLLVLPSARFHPHESPAPPVFPISSALPEGLPPCASRGSVVKMTSQENLSGNRPARRQGRKPPM
ncbi:unnamed protein product [Phytomonas sp. Hart1]|nr:unnamed protein product [Phytomonas sp. Hart1]|eukprot:CCW71660.1 unnamed protein product [Phytomonas sp. isolate Hart1]